MVNIGVDIAGIKMKTPVMTASGTFGFGLEFTDLLNLNEIGAIVVKGTTLKPCPGNTGRRIVETPAGMLNSIGLENPGVHELVTNILPRLSKYDTPIIVNISGKEVKEYGELARILSDSDIAGIEVNISCPNVKEGGIAFGTSPVSAAEVISEVKRNSRVPVIAKLSPNVTDVVVMAKAVEAAGADAISLINTLLGMAIDIYSWKPMLGNVVGGLSGPAIKPVALRMVWQVASAVKLPVIGMGGIMSGSDAVEFMLAGASAVSVGTVNFVNPRAAVEIAEDIRRYLEEQRIQDIKDIVGKLKMT